MKKKSLLKQSILLATLSLSAACFSPALPFVGENHVLVAEAAKPVKLNVAKKTYLIKGKTKTLKLLNTKNKVSWSSSKRAVATINSKGVVKARKTGVTTITATCKGKKYKCTIVVEAPKLSNTKLSLTVGQSRKITLKATKQRVKWVSAKSSIASVNSKGVITAKKPGTVKIAAKIGTRKYYCKVTVKKAADLKPVDIPVTSIVLDKESLDLFIGDSTSLTATTFPSNATSNTFVKWTTSNSDIISVDNGKVVAQKEGMATVSATNGTCSASCKINVNSRFKVDSLNYSIKNGETVKIPITFYGGSGKIAVSKSKYCELNWDSNVNDIYYLNITGSQVGSETLTFSNSLNNETIDIHVDITGLADSCSLSIPEIPATYYRRYVRLNMIDSAFTLTKLDYEFNDSIDGSVALTIYYSGYKSYDANGSKGNYMCGFDWKLYDSDNTVVDSGSQWFDKMQVSDSFKKSFGFRLPAGNYKLVLSDMEY